MGWDGWGQFSQGTAGLLAGWLVKEENLGNAWLVFGEGTVGPGYQPRRFSYLGRRRGGKGRGTTP